MRGFYLTLGLLASCVCLVGWIYRRDCNTNWRPPQRQLAHADAVAAPTMLGGGDCRSGCAERPLGPTHPHSWLVHVTLQGHPRCLHINVEAFAINQSRLEGAEPGSCIRTALDQGTQENDPASRKMKRALGYVVKTRMCFDPQGDVRACR